MNVRRRAAALSSRRPRSLAPGVSWMLAAAVAAASSATLVRLASERSDWRVVVLARASLGLGFALLLARAARAKLVVGGPRALWVRSLAGAAGLLCNFYSFAHLPAAEALVLSATYPLWLSVAAVLLFREPSTLRLWLCVASSVAGVFAMQPPSFDGAKGVPIAVGLVGAVLMAVAMLAVSNVRGVKPEAIVAHFSALACAATLAWMGISGGVELRSAVHPSNLPYLVLVALTSTFANVATTRAYAAGKASTLGAISNLRVAVGAGLDFAVFSHLPGAGSLVGVAAILGATLVEARARPNGGRPAVEAAIARAEEATSCEFRVAVDLRVAGDLRGEAAAVFERLGMRATSRRNAVLLFVDLARGRLVCHADEGAAAALSPDAWGAVEAAASQALAARASPSATLVSALSTLSRQLAAPFPPGALDENELPDDVVGEVEL